MALVGLSSLFIFLKNQPFEEVLREIKYEKEQSNTPEIWEIVDESHHSLNHKRVKLIQDFSSQGYKFTIHSPYFGINLADLDNERRRDSLNKLKKSIELSAEAEAKAIVLHPGIKSKYEHQIKAEILNEESILYLYEYAKSFGLILALENMSSDTQYFMTKPEDFEVLFKRNKVRLKTVLDVGHAHIASVLDDFITKLSDTFFIIHSHDNNGDKDEHLGIGEGSINWQNIISKLIQSDFNSIYIVESVSKPYDSIAKIKKLLQSF